MQVLPRLYFHTIIFCSLILALSSCTTGKKNTSSLSKSALSAYSTDTKVHAKGQQLFQAYCSPCHNFLQKGIGPGLGEVTSLVSPVWLKKFIRNAPELIEQKDIRAVQLFEEYKQLMPPFTNLKDAELEAIMAYIHTQQQAPQQEQVSDLGTALTDPIPTKIAKSGLQLHIEHVMTAPVTADKAPIARINKMQVLPGTPDRLFIQDLRGILYELKDKQWLVAMDMAKERPHFIHAPGMGTGLGSYTFHPDFYQNGLFYTTHTEPAKTAVADFSYADSIKVAMQWVLTEWKLNDPKALPFAGNGRELLRINMVTGIHGVQEITFNPLAKRGDPEYGLLYIGVGDGGASENRYHFICNDKSRVWGSVLRIDPQGKNSKNGRYGIPRDNPYAKLSDAEACREIFCRGFRNPNRYLWTPDGRLLITDIGHANIEELNLGVAGGDYGWPEREGTFVINHRGKMDKVYALPASDSKLNYTYPVAQYDHDEGKAIISGFVYTGTAFPQLRGKYVCGDINNGRLFCVETAQLKQGQQAPFQELELKMGSELVKITELTKGIKPDFRLGLGLNGELFLFTKSDGKVYKVIDCQSNP